jgi:DNA-binding CsgD family transcriptional regulator
VRYATVVISPADDGLHPADAALSAEPAVARCAVNQVTLLEDGTAVMLYRLRGDLARAEALLADRADVLAVDVAGDREGFAYLHVDPNETVETLLAITLTHEIVLDPPVECLPDGGVRVTIVGTGGAIRRAVDEVPGDLGLSLEGLGEYEPEMDAPAARLTDRQREVLEAAVDLGYYEVPRRTTHDEIAATVGLSAGTVGEHLRKVEKKVLSRVVER